MKVNGNVLFIVAAVFGVFTIAGLIILDLTGNGDKAGFFVASIGTITTTILGFGSMLAGMNGQNRQLDSVEMKVNGNLSKVLDAALSNPNADHATVAQVAAETGVAPTGTLPTIVEPPQTGSTEGH